MKKTESKRTDDICLLPPSEQELRLSRLRRLMDENGTRAMLVRDNANIYYLTGRVFSGYIYIDTAARTPVCFVRRPNHLRGTNVIGIRKPEEIGAHLLDAGIETYTDCALELDSLSFSSASRLSKALGVDAAPLKNASPLLRRCRAVKTEFELDLIRQSGIRQTDVYNRIPRLYREGMSDFELQIEIERESRLKGCLGQFRISGDEMELYMGSILTGDNADTPSPYDFAMGGGGMDPSLPVGADGTIIRPGFPVMVDVNGNYTGYMTDMTRCYIAGDTPSEATRANALSIAICDELAKMGQPGASASSLYERALEMAREAGMEAYFMGHRSHAGFVGHGVGIEVNELPVLSPRSKDILEAGNVIAIEPKFVLPGIGAVGIENTYIVRGGGLPMEKTTTAPELIRALE